MAREWEVVAMRRSGPVLLMVWAVGATGAAIGCGPEDDETPSSMPSDGDRPAGEDEGAAEGDGDDDGKPGNDAQVKPAKDAGPGPGSKDGSVSKPPASGAMDSGVPAAPPTTSEGDAGEDPPVVAPGKPRLGITADFLNQTLSIFDLDEMTAGKKRADVLVGSVDLSKYLPGPLALNITPDGKTALVSISAGFLDNFVDVPAGGKDVLLFVDIEKREVVGELDTGGGPMGIIITPDGKRAFVGHYSENYFAVVDIEKKTFTKVNTGSGYNEELAIDDTGTVGILTYGPAGNAKTFSIADPAGTLGQTSSLSGDAAGTAFFPGTKIAYLLQAPTVLTGNSGGHNLVDVSDPKKPVAMDNVRVSSAPTMYPCTAHGPRKTVVYPSTKDNVLSLVEMELEGKVANEALRVDVGAAKSLAYGVATAPDGRVLLAVPGERYVGVVDLETKAAFTVPWEVTKSGPVDIKFIP